MRKLELKNLKLRQWPWPFFALKGRNNKKRYVDDKNKQLSIHFFTETNTIKRANFKNNLRQSLIKPLTKKITFIEKKKKFDTKNENQECSFFKTKL